MYKILRVKNWAQVRDIGKLLMLWGFRGQEDSSWELDTTIHRSARLFNHPSDWLWHREYWMLRQFQRRAHHYVSQLPDYAQKLDWLALMQHYGAPTRLLDFSHSIYVAAYFALERTGGDSAIWAVNLNGLRALVANYFDTNTNQENIDGTNLRHIKLVNQHISGDGVEGKLQSPLVLHVEPELLHERLLIQQGFFLFPCDISKTFQEVLAAAMNTKTNEMNEEQEQQLDGDITTYSELANLLLLKIIVPKSVRVEAIRDLHSMNITAATLFPGLDGFARSMHYHLATWPL